MVFVVPVVMISVVIIVRHHQTAAPEYRQPKQDQ